MRLGLRILVLSLLAAGALGQSPTRPALRLDQVYQQLARPALTQAVSVDNLGFTWGGLRFLLVQGQLALGAPVEGRITTAVFVGTGDIQVLPPCAASAWRQAIERQQMERFLSRSQIEGGLTEAVFRFANAEAWRQALGPKVHFTAGNALSEAGHAIDEAAKAEEKIGSPNIARIAQALDEPAPGDLLLVEAKTHDEGWIEMQFDPALSEPVRVSVPVMVPGTDAVADNVWTQFAPSGAAEPVAASPRLDNYDLDVNIPGNLGLEVTARFTVESTPALGRGLLLGLDSHLRLTSAATSSGAPLDWFQPPGGDWLYLRLPRPFPAGQPLTLTLHYQGNGALVRTLVGQDWISPPAWYPALLRGAPNPPARFALHFTVDKKYRLLATETSALARVAGFVVGEDQESEKTLVLADGKSLALTVVAPAREDPQALMPLAGAKLVDIFNFMGSTFGAYPAAAVGLAISGAIPPTPLPGLVVFDPRSFLDASPELTELSPALSAAGQWWGDWIAPATPRDAWLTLGLVEASGLLYQEARYGRPESLDTARAWRHYLLTRDLHSGHVPEQTGPLWLGADRLTSATDSGADLLLAKGGYIIYMLRQMMLDPRSPAPDAAFIALMRDFTATYGGRDVTAAGFQAVVEKHMTPAMDLDHNHKMDWFFQPLVYGTAVPQLSFHAQEAAAVKGIAQVVLTVDNPQHWRGLLPVYLFKDEDTWVRGLMPITHDQETLTVPAPFTPKYVEANHFEDMLVEVKQ